jgi:hypothetical protein
MQRPDRRLLRDTEGLGLEPRKADASPTKAFFVRMLTRDITLDDCILDLADNSIDAAWESAGEHTSEIKRDDKLSPYRIEITTDRNLFRIKDNCGGIAEDDARKYAFTFGRKDEQPTEDYTVGVYGIGMKRAIFKLGNSIKIMSTYIDAANNRTAFIVPIKVDEWSQDPSEPWDFDLEDHEPADEAGVEIEVNELSLDISRKFEDPTYERTLRALLARDYLLPIMRGLTIIVNGTQVKGASFTLKENADFSPMRSSYEEDGVTVEILAGMAEAPPDDTQPEATNRDTTSGWYVFCNGRAVLSADRSAFTGWGRGSWPQWHGQYNGFLGLILFSAIDSSKLPMTTTKRSVDVSSAIYVRALVEMERQTRAWIDYTNARKADIPEAANRESGGRPVPLPEVKRNENIRLPGPTPKPADPPANVNYVVSRKKLQRLAEGLGNRNLTYREVGIRSFDFAYDHLVDEEQE